MRNVEAVQKPFYVKCGITQAIGFKRYKNQGISNVGPFCTASSDGMKVTVQNGAAHGLSERRGGDHSSVPRVLVWSCGANRPVPGRHSLIESLFLSEAEEPGPVLASAPRICIEGGGCTGVAAGAFGSNRVWRTAGPVVPCHARAT